MALLAISLPAPYEASEGRIEGRAPAGTTDVRVFASTTDGYRLVVRRSVDGGPFAIPAAGLPRGDRTVRVVAYANGRVLGSATVRHVYGLPRLAFRVRGARRTDLTVQRGLKRIDGPGVRAVWMRGMASGNAASYNAGARFTAASTLKLAILMTSLAHNDRRPVAGPVWGAYRRMVIDSDNASANAVEVQMAGSTSAGSAMVNRFCRAVGCRDTEMYGGYELTTARRAAAADIPPVRVEQRPSLPGPGKYTTAHDLGVLLASLVDAAAGRGKARREGITRHEARVAIRLLLEARYPGVIRPNVRDAVGHKAGWLGGVEHDAALIFDARGTIVAVVMSQGGGVGATATRTYARRVLALALKRLGTPPAGKQAVTGHP
jgi:beta-lactamase class A